MITLLVRNERRGIRLLVIQIL